MPAAALALWMQELCLGQIVDGQVLTDAGDLLRDCICDGLAGGGRECVGAYAGERERHVDSCVRIRRAVGCRRCCRGRLRLRLTPCGTVCRRGRHSLQNMMHSKAPSLVSLRMMPVSASVMLMPASAYGAPSGAAAAAEGGCSCPYAGLNAGAGATPCSTGCTAVRTRCLVGPHMMPLSMRGIADLHQGAWSSRRCFDRGRPQLPPSGAVGRLWRRSPGSTKLALQQPRAHPQSIESTLQSAVSAWCSDQVHIPAFRQEA